LVASVGEGGKERTALDGGDVDEPREEEEDEEAGGE